MSSQLLYVNIVIVHLGAREDRQGDLLSARTVLVRLLTNDNDDYSRVLCDIISCLLLLLLLLASNPTPSCFVRFYRKENSSLKYNCEKSRLRKRGRVSFIPQAVALSALYKHARFEIGGHEHLRCSFIWKAERRKETRLRMKTSSGVRQERICHVDTQTKMRMCVNARHSVHKS